MMFHIILLVLGFSVGFSYYHNNIHKTFIFLPGSQKTLPTDYVNVINGLTLQTNTNNINFFKSKNYIDCLGILNNPKNKNIYFITHSFGGYFGLLYSIFYKKRVKGIVLLNSHFNQNRDMPYFPIQIKDIDIPVLTILSTNDKMLPFQKAINDLYYNHLIFNSFEFQQNKTQPKMFLFNDGEHNSCSDDKKYSDITLKQICEFLSGNWSSNITEPVKIIDKNIIWKIKNTIDYQYSSFNIFDYIFYRKNILDFLLMNFIVSYGKLSPILDTKQLFNSFFFPYFIRKFGSFLSSKPTKKIQCMYSQVDDVLLKTAGGISFSNLTSTFEEQIQIFYDEYYLSNSTNHNETHKVKIVWNKIYFPPNKMNSITLKYILSPSILGTWFLFKPRVYVNEYNNSKQKRNNGKKKKIQTIHCDVLIVPIRDEVVYYKFPSKFKVIKTLLEKRPYFSSFEL